MSEVAARVHRWPVRVYYEDTDAGGVVYHAQYLCFCERARTEFLRAIGLDHPRLRAGAGVVFTVRRASLDFRAPARLDDALEVVTRVPFVGGARVFVHQTIERDGQVLCNVNQELAVVGEDLRPRRLPSGLADRLLAWTCRDGPEATP